MLAKFDGTKLHEVREQQDMSQAELAARAGTTIRYVRALEKGKKRNPSAQLLCKLAIALDVPMETFIQESTTIFTMSERQTVHYYELIDIT